jgi:hypothetical protein
MTNSKLLCTVFLTALAIAAQPDAARGVVFLDADGDGVRDAGERGIAGVVVSDQIEVTFALAHVRT